MPRYIFKSGGPEHGTIDARDLEDALKQAGPSGDKPYEPAEGDDPYKKFLLMAILDESFDP